LTGKHAITVVAVVTAMLSVASWTYRYIDEYSPANALLFYVLVPFVIWLLFLGPLLMLRLQKTYLRVLAVVLLIPTAALWIVSILVGIYGLKIH